MQVDNLKKSKTFIAGEWEFRVKEEGKQTDRKKLVDN